MSRYKKEMLSGINKQGFPHLVFEVDSLPEDYGQFITGEKFI